MDAAIGFDGRLETRVIRGRRPHRARVINIPKLGRIIFSPDGGDSFQMASEYFQTHLEAVHRRAGKFLKAHDLGSGLVTNVGVTAMANDANWAAPSGASVATLALARWHASGTGATAAATSDIQLQTPAGPTATEAVEGTHALVSAANTQIYKSIATLSYTETLAITEWGLLTEKILSATTGTPFTATAAAEATVTGTPLTASSSTVQGQQQKIVKAGTTASYGLILSNTTSKLTIPAWYKTADGTAGSTPGGTEAYTLRPVLWDHKVFSAINVVSGDTIEFKYSLTINSGG